MLSLRNYSSKTALVGQSRFLLTPVTGNETDNNDYTWWVPLSMTTPSLGFDKTSPDAWLNPAQAETPMEIEMDIGDEPLIVNVQQTGFYRVNYDHTNWDMLSTALVNNHEQIHRYINQS